MQKQHKLFTVRSEGDLMGNNKYHPCSTQEWRDSMYTFNKSTNKLIPVQNNYIFDLLRSYFNLFNKSLEKKIGLLRIRKWKRRLIGRKIWISKPELKYSNHKIIINIYVYNRQLTFLIKKLKKLKINWGKLIKKTSILKFINKKTNFFFKKRKILFKNKFKFIRILRIIKEKTYIQNVFTEAIKLIKTETKLIKSKYDYINNTEEYKDILYIANSIKKKPSFLNKKRLNFIANTSYLSFIENTLTTQMSFLYIKQMILLNKLKFKESFILPIKLFIEEIYDKKIDFNLVYLKKFNYDSNILAQIVTTKIRNRRNKPLRVVKSSVRKSKVYEFNKGLLKKDKIKLINKQNFVLVNNIKNSINSGDSFNNILNNRLSSNNIEDTALNLIKNKVIAGVKVQATGRITRRIIAQRATYKARYKGTLKSVDSSYKGISAVILKGYEKSGLQYTHLDSKRRIGAFGIKTWINAY